MIQSRQPKIFEWINFNKFHDSINETKFGNENIKFNETRFTSSSSKFTASAKPSTSLLSLITESLLLACFISFSSPAEQMKFRILNYEDIITIYLSEEMTTFFYSDILYKTIKILITPLEWQYDLGYEKIC
jgi:hypothetical protein